MKKKETIDYKGFTLSTKNDWAGDVMNRWLYTVVDFITIDNITYSICKKREVDGGELFAVVGKVAKEIG